MILGGHEHDPFFYQQKGRMLVKCGKDAEFVSVIYIKFGKQIKLFSQLIELVNYKSDSDKKIKQHEFILEIAEKLILYNNKEILSTLNVRNSYPSFPNLVLKILRTELNVNIVLLNSGCFRFET